MPATPRQFDLTAEDIRAAANLAVQRRTGPDAVPIFGDDDQYPRIWDINDLKNRPEAQWLIGNIVEEKGLTVFFGSDKIGKTAVLSNFLWAWTAGHDTFLNPDFEMKGDNRTVLYVLLEGQANFYSRYDAWCHAYNQAQPLENFYVMDEGLSLFQARMEWENPATWTASARKLWNAVDALRPQVLVIDTLSRATAGMDENSSSMAHVVGMLDNMRDVFDLATVIVHHTSLADGDRPRGHSSLKGAASSYARIEGKPEDQVLTFITGPHRNSDVFLRVPFKRVHERGSFVIDKAQAVSKTSKQDHLYALAVGGDIHVVSAAHSIYGDKTKTKNVVELARNHPNLRYEDGQIWVVDQDQPEEL